MSFSNIFFNEVVDIATQIDTNKIEDIAKSLHKTQINKGRVFVLGVGGSAGNASQMVNDLRKLCNIEAYAPTDNSSELTARTNDEGFDTIFEQFLQVSRFNKNDTIFVLSVGGGNEEKNVSIGLIKAIKYAKEKTGTVLSIVGKSDGYAAHNSDVSIIIPIVEPTRITPHSEAFQAVVWHCLVSHPILQMNKTKW